MAARLSFKLFFPCGHSLFLFPASYGSENFLVVLNLLCYIFNLYIVKRY